MKVRVELTSYATDEAVTLQKTFDWSNGPHAGDGIVPAPGWAVMEPRWVAYGPGDECFVRIIQPLEADELAGLREAGWA